MKRKILPQPMLVRVSDVLEMYNRKKMAIVKSFQRRSVWDRSTTNSYLESVSEGTAVSGIIVADIRTGIEASESSGDVRGKKEYEKLDRAGYDSVNEDGQNRLGELIDFCNDKFTFTGTLYDLDHKPREFVNVKFGKLPDSFKHAFKNSHVVVVTVQNAPWNKLPHMFRKLNSGMPLNRIEMRQSIQTPISEWFRSRCEGTFKDMWPRLSGCSENAILRMRDIEWMSQAVLTLNSHTKDRFFRDDDLDWFYNLGEGKILKSVTEYDSNELDRAEAIVEIVRKTIELQQTVPDSKNVPQKTFWALLILAEYIYDKGYQVVSYDQFYQDVYRIDARLDSDSKIQQGNDYVAARQQYPHETEDELKLRVRDNDYYWRQCNRMENPTLRAKRKSALIDTLMAEKRAGTVSSLKKPQPIAAK